MDHKQHQPAPPVDAPICASATYIADVAAYLRSALTQAWQVVEHSDPAGERSLVILASDDDPALPTFLLHSRTLVPHVATIADDAWQTEQQFASWPDAAEAIVALALAAQPTAAINSQDPSAGWRHRDR
jgi:hypothetical protein